jgi:DNA-binding helix-hairpin-helix protein with protein kinase domain
LEYVDKISKLREDQDGAKKLQLSHAKKLIEIKRDETKKLALLERKYQDLVSKENRDVAAILDKMNRDIAGINIELHKINRQKKEEINRELNALQKIYIEQGLARVKISDNSISGIGEGLKSTLRAHGIYTAADIGQQLYNVPGFGPSRIASLQAFKSMATSQFQKTAPQTLPASALGPINKKFDSQIVDLQRKENAIRAEAQTKKIEITNKYRNEKNLSKQELDKTKSRFDTDKQNLNMLLRGDQEKVEKCQKSIQYLEKNQIVYRNLTLGNYIKRVVSIKK